MRWLIAVGLTGWLAGGWASAQEGDKDARAVIDKGLKAMGGAGNLNKFAASQSKGKGTIHIMNMALPFTGAFDFQQPDQFRHTVEVEVNNQKFATIQVYDGKKAWTNMMNETKEIDDDKLITEFKEAVHAQRVISLYKLDKGFAFASVGEVKVKDKAALGVRVSFKGRRDINLFFDKDNGFLVKAEYRALDPITMKEVGREEFFSNFKAVGGIQTPHTMVIDHDGKRFLEMEVTEARYLDRHDVSLFAKP